MTCSCNIVKRWKTKRLNMPWFRLLRKKNTASTTIITTTGEDSTGRKRLTAKDLIGLKKKLDKLPQKRGRVLVLCSDHTSIRLAH